MALALVHNQVLASRSELARRTVRDYGIEMPRVWSSWLLRAGDRLGAAGWVLVCGVIRGRELQKAMLLRLKGSLGLLSPISYRVPVILKQGTGERVGAIGQLGKGQ